MMWQEYYFEVVFKFQYDFIVLAVFLIKMLKIYFIFYKFASS